MSESNDPVVERLDKLIAIQERPKVWASLGATINTGNYENQKVDIGVTGIPVGASKEYIAEQMVLAQKTLQEVVDGLATQMHTMLGDMGK